MQFIFWYVLISFIGLAAFPITRRIFRKAQLRGIFSPGLLAFSYGGWGTGFLGLLA